MGIRVDTQSGPAESSEEATTPRVLPFDGELSPAKHKQFIETVVFVHHFGGSKATLLRHSRLLNELGFDTVRFNLSLNQAPLCTLPVTADFHFGVRYVWKEQIESILNSVSGKKIVYSFSMPSNSAFAAIAERRARDITAWICDGGPFLDLVRSTWNLYKHQYRVNSRLLRGLFTALSMGLYGFGIERELAAQFASLPRRDTHGFPVLSFRGGKDPLVSPSAIDTFFSYRSGPSGRPGRSGRSENGVGVPAAQTTNREHSHHEASSLALRTCLLPDAGHLDGLKRFPDPYTAELLSFLEAHASRMATLKPSGVGNKVPKKRD